MPSQYCVPLAVQGAARWTTAIELLRATTASTQSESLALARTHWERSTELRQKVGHLLGALAQQTLLAVLARDEGNPEASRALATEINR